MVKTILIIALIILFVYELNSQWIENNPNSGSGLNSIFFVSVNTGWVAGSNGIILRTSNGGLDWNSYQYNNLYTLNSITFVNDNTGYVTGTTYQSNLFYFNSLLKTTNGGQNWNVIISQPAPQSMPMHFTSIGFFDNTKGLLTCSGSNTVQSRGQLLRTENGGSNWINIGMPQHISFKKVVCLNSSTAFVLADYWIDTYGRDTVYVLKTTDSGNSWSEIYRSKGTGIVNITSANGILNLIGENPVNYGGLFIQSKDYGASWDTLINGETTSLITGYFINGNTGWAAGYDGKILYTVNAGINWMTQFQGGQYSVNDLQLFSNCSGWASTSNGKLLKTTNCGVTVVSLSQNEIPTEFGLFQNYPNPFNPVTKIKFAISGTSAVQTFLTVYDALGRDIDVLVNEQLQPGIYEADWDASAYPSGVYFYKLEIRQAGSPSGTFTETKKMVLIK